MRAHLYLLPLVAALACGGSSDSTGPGDGGGTTGPVATTSVTMSGSRFTPAAIRVAPAATVTWTNSDEGTLHNVKFAATAGGIGTTDFSTGSRSLQMPNAPGTYAYSCTFHTGMNGSVTVQ